MAGPLLETKFHRPAAPGRLVDRPRLDERLAGAASATLVLVSAPAGFGKTTVMAQLADRVDADVAWLSLDAADNDPMMFWTYVVEALDRAVPGVGKAARSVLAGSSGSVDAALTMFVNDVARDGSEVVLALDDFHVIEAAQIHAGVAYLVDHLPANAHLVIGTRADPPIPLARLRARGTMIEVRASDLRFSTDEAGAYLRRMGLALGDDDVAALEGRTEGWIAALQLAALSLQGRADPTEFISAFAGDDRYIVDYLVEEVLRRQPPDVRDFLLKTSILSRFTGPLVDAVTGSDGGAETIAALDRGNLFVIALDSQRRWYRYHHLFGGVLQAHLTAEQPDEVPGLHRRASEWYAAQSDRLEAIEHAFAAGDVERVADLIELGLPEMTQQRRWPIVRRWLDSLPPEAVRRRPVLAVGYAGTILSSNQSDGVAELLDAAERQTGVPRDGSDARSVIVKDPAQLARVPVMIELYRAALAKLGGDLEGNIAHARRVLDLVGDEDPVARGGAETFVGLAYWGRGDLDAGFRWYAAGMASLERAGMIADVVGGAIVGADIRLAQGRLGDAQRLFESGLARAISSEPPLSGATDMHTGLADIAYQRGRLDEAKVHLDAGRRLGDDRAFPRDPYRSRLVLARIRQAEGELEAALSLLDEAERLYVGDFSPDIRPVPAIRARVLTAHGRLRDARAWAEASGVSSTDELSYLREYEHTTLARLLVGEALEGGTASLPVAVHLLDGLAAAADAGRRDGSSLEILAVQALARETGGDHAGALAALDAALAIAERDGYVMVFVDEGPPMIRLLRAAAKRSRSSAHIQTLLLHSQGTAAPTDASQRGLVEPLSERELDVLRLLRSDLSGPEMAGELVVSLNTLRTHTKNIYAKLGVRSRRAAVRRAEELELP